MTQESLSDLKAIRNRFEHLQEALNNLEEPTNEALEQMEWEMIGLLKRWEEVQKTYANA